MTDILVFEMADEKMNLLRICLKGVGIQEEDHLDLQWVELQLVDVRVVGLQTEDRWDLQVVGL